ncbi:hypothetical protein AVEN_59796-1, partial [Araneus ventricosus]
MIFAVLVDIDVYDASGNIVHIAGKSQFPMLRKKRQYKHRNGDDCVTSIFFDASEIGTVLPRSRAIVNERSRTAKDFKPRSYDQITHRFVPRLALFPVVRTGILAMSLGACASVRIPPITVHKCEPRATRILAKPHAVGTWLLVGAVDASVPSGPLMSEQFTATTRETTDALTSPERPRIFPFRRQEITRTAEEICGLSDRGTEALEKTRKCVRHASTMARAAKLNRPTSRELNPYIKISMVPDSSKRVHWRTTVQKGQKNPVFNQKFSFEVLAEDSTKRLVFSVWHRDLAK